MDIKEELLRKIEIRTTAKRHTGVQEVRLNETILTKNFSVYEEFGALLWTLDEYSTLTIHTPMPIHLETGILKKIVKKVIRKVFEKTLGWYYFPIVEQQCIYNQTCGQILKKMEAVIEAQDKEIELLKRNAN